MATTIHTPTATRIPMTTDWLALTQWLSPAFPLGSFAYSHGLETAISLGEARCGQSLTAWIEVVLTDGTGIVDATLLSMVHRGEMEASEAAGMAQALATSAERWEETIAQGRAFIKTTNAILSHSDPALPLPVAVGLVARTLNLPTQTVAATALHAFTSNLVQAGVRFIPLGQTEGQQVLAALHPVIDVVAARAATAHIDDVTTNAFGADLAAMAHETLDVRIYRT